MYGGLFIYIHHMRLHNNAWRCMPVTRTLQSFWHGGLKETQIVQVLQSPV